MSQARKRALAAKSGSAIGAVLNPTHGYRDELERRGIKPRNHHRTNIRNLKKLQLDNRERQEASTVKEDPFKISKFKNVESRVLKQEPAAEPQEKFEFLQRKKKEDAPKPVASKPRQRMKRKADVPRERGKLLPRKSRDIIHENYLKNKRAPSKKKIVQKPPTKDENFGKVPTYLLERKVELAQQQAAREKAGRLPSGVVRMSEEERLETLDVLEKNKNKLYAQFQRLPLTVHTQKQIKLRENLEAKLKEVEEAIDVFSRDEVFVTAQ